MKQQTAKEKMNGEFKRKDRIPDPYHLMVDEKIQQSITVYSSEITTTENYFGENARISFFQRFRWLSNQSKITLSDLRQPFDVAHLQFPSVDIPELDLNEIANFAEQHSSGIERNESYSGLISHGDDLGSIAGRSLSTISKQSSFFGIANSAPSTTPTHHKQLTSSTGPTKRSIFRYHAVESTPRTPKCRTSFPMIQKIGKQVPSVSSRRSYSSNRSIRSSFSPELNTSPSSTPSDAEDVAFMSEFFQQSEDFSSRDERELQLISPRTKFIASCIKDKINPRASLLLRKHITTKLDLKHQGMNDQMAKSFAKSLQHLPYLESLNVADNMLNDVGLTAIIQAVGDIPGLKELNLSQNRIGFYTAKALKEYLSAESCSLEVLILNNSNINDSQCAQFIHAIGKKTSLVELDLSHNSVGKSEKVYSQKHSSSLSGGSSSCSLTGPQAIAELLQSENCKLKKLNLEWNLIRLDGATSLMKSLAINQTMMDLNLSYNTLNTEAAVALGVSMLKNQSLQKIDLSYTSIDSIGCITICAGIIENRSLKKVILDGNPIGDQGGKALLISTIFAVHHAEISAMKCNVTIRDAKCWFDFDRLNRDYTLNMQNGFDRAVMIFLSHILAGHPTLRFAKLNYEGTAKTGKGDGKLRPINLISFLSNEPEKYFNEKQQQVFQSLQRIQEAAANYKAAVKFFEETDTDGSGVLEFGEFTVLMHKLGVDISEKRLQQIMKKYDTDGSNTIDVTGFLMLLRHQRGEALSRLKDMRFAPVMILSDDKPLNPSIYPLNYIPPETGNLHIAVVSDMLSLKSDGCRVLTSCQCDYLIKISNQLGSSNLLSLISACIETVRIRYNEAIMLADIMLLESSNKIEVTRKILLQMHDANDTAHFLHAIFGEHRQEVIRFKWEFNFLLKPLLGCPNGYYTLDLTKDLHRRCLMKLLEINSLQTAARMEQSKLSNGRLGDLSQNGGFSCFRNELFNGKPLLVNNAFISPMPTAGKLEFDFTSSERPPKDLIVISDRKFLRLLLKHYLLKPTDVGIALFKLEEGKQLNQLSLLCKGMNCYECPPERAKLIADHMEEFYQKLEERAQQHQETREKICKPVTEIGDSAVVRDSYPMPTSLVDYFLLDEQHRAIDQAATHFSLNTSQSLDDGENVMNPVDVQQFLQEEKNTELPSPGNMWDSENSSPFLQIKSEHLSSVDDKHSVFPSGLSPYRAVNSPKRSLHVVKDTSLKGMKIKQDFKDEEEFDESENNPATVEAIDWVHEYELVKESRLTNLRKMKSKRLKDMIRRLSFLREKNFVIFPTTDEFLKRFKTELESNHVQDGLKAHKLVDLLEEVLSRSWLYARHLALLLECFMQFGYYKQTQFFGTYRVELVVSLFTRVIDIHNFEMVLQVLSPFEVACVICRLGYLHIFNPCKPEGSWELDLSRREERLIVKMLCTLGIHEPGDNFLYECFRWSRESESMPGWELTQSWLTDEGLPSRGVLSLTYYSGEGKELHGCKPFVSFRKALLSLVLINEEELTNEDLRGKPRDHKKILPGDRCFHKYRGLWENYFVPTVKESKKK